jgi:hypothetical protein
MPTEEQFRSDRLKRTPEFSQSRDYKGDNFLDYIQPSFYGGGVPRWTGLLVLNQLRANNELVALNEPDLGEIFIPERPQLRGSRVSPQIPNGVYKKIHVLKCTILRMVSSTVWNIF